MWCWDFSDDVWTQDIDVVLGLQRWCLDSGHRCVVGTSAMMFELCRDVNSWCSF